MSNLDWMDDGDCREIGWELFFAEGKGTSESKTAKKICEACPVVWTCREYALSDKEIDGVWGATTLRDRQRIRRERVRRYDGVDVQELDDELPVEHEEEREEAA